MDADLDRWFAEHLDIWVKDKFYPNRNLFSPTSNIAHTQMVWEKMRTKGFRVTMFIRKHPDLWTCHINRKGLSHIIAEDSHDSIKMAVCLAVKAALESESA